MRIIILLLLPLISLCQGNQIKFIDYSDVLMDLKQKGKSSQYYKNLDYESMLYLDKACIRELLGINPDFIKEKSIDTAMVFSEIPNEAISKIFTSEKDMSNFFLANNNHGGIFLNMSAVYIKDRRKAVFVSFDKTISRKYRLTMMKGYVQVELLYEEIE